jgi:hypothetical protein
MALDLGGVLGHTSVLNEPLDPADPSPTAAFAIRWWLVQFLFL